MAGLERAGVRDKALLLESDRLVTRAECLLVHSSQHWEQLLSTATQDPAARQQTAQQFDSVFLTSGSARCARLAAGGVLSCLECVAGGRARTGLVLHPPVLHCSWCYRQ